MAEGSLRAHLQRVATRTLGASWFHAERLQGVVPMRLLIRCWGDGAGWLACVMYAPAVHPAWDQLIYSGDYVSDGVDPFMEGLLDAWAECTVTEVMRPRDLVVVGRGEAAYRMGAGLSRVARWSLDEAEALDVVRRYGTDMRAYQRYVRRPHRYLLRWTDRHGQARRQLYLPWGVKLSFWRRRVDPSDRVSVRRAVARSRSLRGGGQWQQCVAVMRICPTHQLYCDLQAIPSSPGGQWCRRHRHIPYRQPQPLHGWR